jgi:hypothetical protein
MMNQSLLVKILFLMLIITIIIIYSCVSTKIEYVSTEYEAGDFKLVFDASAADICISGDDDPAVIRAAGDLQTSIKMIRGLQPP